MDTKSSIQSPRWQDTKNDSLPREIGNDVISQDKIRIFHKKQTTLRSNSAHPLSSIKPVIIKHDSSKIYSAPLIPQVAMMRCFVFISMTRTARITEPVGSVRSPYWVPCIRLVGPRLKGFGAATCPVFALRLSLVWHPSADSLWPCLSCFSCRPWVTPF